MDVPIVSMNYDPIFFSFSFLSARRRQPHTSGDHFIPCWLLSRLASFQSLPPGGTGQLEPPIERMCH